MNLAGTGAKLQRDTVGWMIAKSGFTAGGKTLILSFRMESAE